MTSRSPLQCPHCGRGADILVNGRCDECGRPCIVDTIEDLRPE